MSLEAGEGNEPFQLYWPVLNSIMFVVEAIRNIFIASSDYETICDEVTER